MRVLSLGAGVQSTTLALLAAEGEIEPPDVAIFADTGWEPPWVYEHLQWLMSPNVLPFPVVITSAGNIREAVRWRSINGHKRHASIPWHTVNPDGSEGMGRRQCSNEYKRDQIAKEIRRLVVDRQVDLVERHPLPVHEGSPPHHVGPVLAQGAVGLDEVVPDRRVIVADVAPVVRVAAVGAAEASGLLWFGIAVPAQPQETVVTPHPQIDQRVDVVLPALLWLAHAVRLVDADAEHHRDAARGHVRPPRLADDRQGELLDEFGQECSGGCGV